MQELFAKLSGDQDLQVHLGIRDHEELLRGRQNAQEVLTGASGTSASRLSAPPTAACGHGTTLSSIIPVNSSALAIIFFANSALSMAMAMGSPRFPPKRPKEPKDPSRRRFSSLNKRNRKCTDSECDCPMRALATPPAPQAKKRIQQPRRQLVARLALFWIKLWAPETVLAIPAQGNQAGRILQKPGRTPSSTRARG